MNQFEVSIPTPEADALIDVESNGHRQPVRLIAEVVIDRQPHPQLFHIDGLPVGVTVETVDCELFRSIMS